MTMRKPTPREIFFMVVLVGFGIGYLAYRDKGGLFGGRQEDAKKPRELGIAPIVRLADLAARAEDYDPNGRNLFEYYTPPPPRRQHQAQREVQPPKPQVVQDRRPPKPVQQQKNPVNAGLSPPSIRFKYIGYLGPKNDKIAVFENGDEMLLARAGEVVDKDFTVVEFKYESIVMGYVDTRFKDRTTELNMRRN